MKLTRNLDELRAAAIATKVARIKRAAEKAIMGLFTGATDRDSLIFKEINMTAGGVRLLKIKGERGWTPQEAAMAQHFENTLMSIEAIRAASNIAEAEAIQAINAATSPAQIDSIVNQETTLA